MQARGPAGKFRPNKFDWAEAVVDSFLLGMITFLTNLVTQFQSVDLRILELAALQGLLAFFIVLATKRGLLKKA